MLKPKPKPDPKDPMQVLRKKIEGLVEDVTLSLKADQEALTKATTVTVKRELETRIATEQTLIRAYRRIIRLIDADV